MKYPISRGTECPTYRIGNAVASRVEATLGQVAAAAGLLGAGQ
jgi:hypothetical protein